MKRPDWLKGDGVEEVCSASCCVSSCPGEWGEPNEMCVFDTPEKATSVVDEDPTYEYDLYAFKMFPVIFREGRREAFEIPAIEVTPLPDSFELLGYDTVSRSCGTTFECSPLSCNNMAQYSAVNRHCLVDDAEIAFELAAKFEAEQCEPGPYHVVEIWREKRDKRRTPWNTIGELRERYKVQINNAAIELSVTLPGKTAWHASIAWTEIIRVCIEAEDNLVCEAWHIFTKLRRECFVVPAGVEGGDAIRDELVKRKLFDAE